MLHFSHYTTDSYLLLATYYDPNGGTGACPPYNSLGNNDLIVALGSGHWNGGSHCGETMTVKYGSNTVNVVVQDLCPGCQGANGIDLTPGAISQLDSNYVNDGKITVNWTLPTLP
ncbi:RlpA-like double-psi beta-barrel-protein domain-containing protein-containing protein [Mycena galopus ATCC 62051]|nr:RlpA-like double-psi beta-barrel-protein domain-containing protein-containing protein [Mycena galopus ATCC 62051]